MNYKITVGSKSLSKSKNIIFIVYLFCVIYMPPLFKDGMMNKIVLLISAGYVLLNLKHMLRLLHIKENKRMIYVSFFLLCYSLIISMVNVILNSDSGAYFDRPMIVIIFMIYFFIIAGAVVIYCQKNNISSEKFLKILVLVGLVQAVFVFASFFFSGIRSELLHLIAENASSDKIAATINDNHYTALRRNFGFADTLYDRFGYTCSILCAISFNIALYKKKWSYYIASLIFVFSTLVNARSGVLLCIIAMIVSILIFMKRNKDFRKMLKLIGFIGIAIIICIGALRVIRLYAPETSEWMQVGLESFLGELELTSGNENSSFYLSNETWFFPDPFAFIFGTARDPIYIIGRSTDNGYVEQIWNIGIIGLLISMSLFVGTIKRTLRNCTSDLERGVLFSMIVLILLYMIKLFAYKNIGGTYIILGYCFLLNSLYANITLKENNKNIETFSNEKDN